MQTINGLKNVELQEIAQELDDELGSLQIEKVAINDIRIIADSLYDQIENVEIEDFKVYYYKVQHQVRVLRSLLSYVNADLNKTYEEIDELTSALFKKVVKENEL